MRILAVSLFLAVPLFCSCRHVSVAEGLLWQMREHRNVIQAIHDYRESAGTFVPIEKQICETLTAFDEVISCQCVIAPETFSTATGNQDGSITYGQTTEVRIRALVTLVTPKAWDADTAREKFAGLLGDHGFRHFTLELPKQSGATWIIQGTSKATPPSAAATTQKANP